jgi:chaperonin GroEL
LVDKKITDASEIIRILDSAVKENYPLLIVAEDVEEAAMADLIKNKLKGTIKVAAVKAFSFGEQKTQCLDDVAVMTGGMELSHQSNQCNSGHQQILVGFQVQ